VVRYTKPLFKKLFSLKLKLQAIRPTVKKIQEKLEDAFLPKEKSNVCGIIAQRNQNHTSIVVAKALFLSME